MRDLIRQRPRLINLLHAVHLYPAYSSTTAGELECLARHAKGRRVAIEIGTHMGVSAVAIATALADDGVLYCVDPWPRKNDRENPSWLVCDRELRRNRIADRIRYVRGLSTEVAGSLPDNADFMFVDGDHSRRGIEADWEIVKDKLAVGGVACFHDTSVAEETTSKLESIDFFREVIANDDAFTHVETRETLNVIRRAR